MFSTLINNYIKLLLLLFCCFQTPAFADENSNLLSNIAIEIERGNVETSKKLIELYFSSLFKNADYSAVKNAMVELSPLVRKSQSREIIFLIEDIIFREREPLVSLSVESDLLVNLSYDLMYFAEFERLFIGLQRYQPRLKKWSPVSAVDLGSKANLMHIYGQLLVRKKRVSEALEYFFEAEAVFKSLDQNHPSIFTIQVIVGEAYLEAGNHERAEFYLRKALQVIPSSRTDGISYITGLLASSILKQGKAIEALQVIETYLDDPVDLRRDYFLFMSLRHLEVLRSFDHSDRFHELAQNTFELAKEIQNKDYLSEAKQHIGYSLIQKGLYDQAEVFIREAVEGQKDIRDHANLQAYLDLVSVLELKNNYQQALQYHKIYHGLSEQDQQRINQSYVAELSTQYDVVSAKQAEEKALLQLQIEKQTRFTLYSTLILSGLLVSIIALILFLLNKVRSQNKELHTLSRTDSLTGVENRYALTQAINISIPDTLIIIDMDHLKYYNDKYGHDKGDQLLQMFSNLIKELSAKLQGKLYRLGGMSLHLYILIQSRLPKLQKCSRQ